MNSCFYLYLTLLVILKSHWYHFIIYSRKFEALCLIQIVLWQIMLYWLLWNLCLLPQTFYAFSFYFPTITSSASCCGDLPIDCFQNHFSWQFLLWGVVLSCSIIRISHRHLHVAQTKCILLRPTSTDLLVQQNSGNNVTSLVFSVSCADTHCSILVFTVVFSYISIQLSIVSPFPFNSQACLWLKPLLFLTSFYSKSSWTSKRNYTPPLVNCHFKASSIPPLFA